MAHTAPFSIAMRQTYAISVGAALLLLATVVTGIYLGLETQKRFRNVSESWSQFAERADRKGVWISELRGHLGYGGIIHNFKNYVLRQDGGYAAAVRQQLKSFYQTAEAFIASDVSVEERSALEAIRRTIGTYEARLPIADQAAREKWQISETDRLVKVDDTEAVSAMAMLEETWRQTREKASADFARTVGEGEALIDTGFSFLIGLGAVALVLFALYYMLTRQIRDAFHRLSNELADRLRAEQGEKKLKRAVEQSPATIVITDTQGRIEYVNRRFEELTGYGLSEVVGSTPRFLQSGETTPEQYAAITSQLSQGKEWRGVFRNRRKDGDSYWAETTIFPLTDDDGETRNFIGIGEDLTEKRKAREQVVKAQKLEAIGLLAGGVAHDFNNVLTTILGASHLAAMDVDPQSDVGREISQIEIAARRAQSLVQQLLTFARRQPGDARALDLCREVQEVVRLIRASVPRTIEVVVAETSSEPAWVRADPIHLHQVIMNLCRNAAEAVPPVAGVIRIKVERQAVEVSSRALSGKPGGWVRLWIEDNGPGVAPDVAKRMFDAFFTTKPIGKGTGLGLTMVATLLEEMGGGINVAKSTLGGAAFEVVLPLSSSGEGAPEQSSEMPRGTESILLVDDEDDVLATQRRLLMRLGYRVAAYSDPASALSAFAKDPARFDLVLTDLVMPGLNGEELAKEIRRLKPDVPIIINSAYRSEPAGQVDEAGYTVLAKPTNPPELARKLRELLSEAASPRNSDP